MYFREWTANEADLQGASVAPDWPDPEEEASKRIGEGPIVEQHPNLGANVCPHVVRRGVDITHNLRTAIDDGDDVFEVMARDDVIATAPVKRFQLGGHDQGRRDDSYVVSGKCSTSGPLRSRSDTTGC
jgi:hypothetical protein